MLAYVGACRSVCEHLSDPQIVCRTHIVQCAYIYKSFSLSLSLSLSLFLWAGLYPKIWELFAPNASCMTIEHIQIHKGKDADTKQTPTHGCVLRQMMGRNFATEMNLARLWTSVLGYLAKSKSEKFTRSFRHNAHAGDVACG